MQRRPLPPHRRRKANVATGRKARGPLDEGNTRKAKEQYPTTKNNDQG
ncbi:MAG: hypothetical protein U5L00_18455 [Desulfovermiculus sp.]|nr:hypothetical protein [Desulfovermiculus sp.]